MNRLHMIAKDQGPQRPTKDAVDRDRRATLRRLGRFAAVTPPVVTLMLSAATKRALAAPSATSSRQFKEPVSVPQLRGLA